MSAQQRLRAQSERGSITVFLTIFGMCMVLCLGLVVDGAGRNNAQQQASWVASEAARAAGQQVDASAVLGDVPRADPARAASTAREFLAEAGFDGVVQVSGDTLVVTTTGSYSPKILRLGAQTVTGRAEVRLART